MIRTNAQVDRPFEVAGYLMVATVIMVAILSFGFHLFSPGWMIIAVVGSIICSIFLIVVRIFIYDVNRRSIVTVGRDTYFIASIAGRWIGGKTQPVRYSNNIFYTEYADLYYFPTGDVVTSFSRQIKINGLPDEISFQVSFLVEFPVLVVDKGLIYNAGASDVAKNTSLEKRVMELFKMIHTHIPDEVISKVCLDVSKGEIAERDKLLGELKQSMQKQFDLNNLGCKVNSVTMSL